MIYRQCPICGANLDPGERCDCRENEKGRPGDAGAAHGNKALPRAVYQSTGQKSSAILILNMAMKGAAAI